MITAPGTSIENQHEACPRCHFDPAAWNEQDRARTLQHFDGFIDLALEGFERPWGHYDRAINDALDALRQAANAGPAGVQLHALFHEMHRLALIRHEAEDIVSMEGTVHQVSGSGGGVPKEPVLSGQIDRNGLVGDRQASRQHHGRPWQALCLWSTDVIDALVEEGHPIAAGCAGENLTVTGIDWAQLRSGLHVRIGEIHAVVSAPAFPCSKIGRWFHDQNSNRIEHERHPGWARWYASVITGGSVSPGDGVTISSSAERR